MLDDDGIVWLARELMATAEALGQTLSDNAAGLMAADLSTFPKEQLRTALGRTRMECSGRLTLKFILDQLDALQGRLGVNEAWALALRTRDERETVVWTDEIEQAWVAASSMAQGRDLVGARMAFKDAYERITLHARDTLKRPETRIAVGWDAERRLQVVVQAQQEGQLSLEQAQSVLSPEQAVAVEGRLVALAAPTPSIGYDKDGRPFKQLQAVGAGTGLVPLLTTSARQLPEQSGGLLAPNVVAKIREIQAQAKNADKKRARRVAAQARLERMKLAQAKRRADQAVQNYKRGGAT